MILLPCSELPTQQPTLPSRLRLTCQITAVTLLNHTGAARKSEPPLALLKTSDRIAVAAAVSWSALDSARRICLLRRSAEGKEEASFLLPINLSPVLSSPSLSCRAEKPFVLRRLLRRLLEPDRGAGGSGFILGVQQSSLSGYPFSSSSVQRFLALCWMISDC
ncbi:unnamed protein product [Urochloa humidicola]